MNIFSNHRINPMGMLFVLIGFVLVGMGLGAILLAVVVQFVPEFLSMTAGAIPFSGDFYRTMILVNFPLIFLLPTFAAAYVYNQGKAVSYLKLNVKPTVLFIMAGIAVMLIAQPGLNWLGDFNKNIALPPSFDSLLQWIAAKESEAEVMSSTISHTTSVGVLLINLLLLAIMPGVCEELLFRGMIQPLFYDWLGRKHLAIWVSAFLFSAIHLQFFGFLPRLLLGAILGYLVMYSGSIWPAIVAHTFNNGLVTVVEYFKFNKQISSAVDTFGIGATAWIGLLSLLLTLLFFPFIVKKKTV